MADVAVLIARLTLGGIWMIAGLAKLASRESRGQMVEAFGMLRGRPAQAVGLALPYMELSLGLLLLSGEWVATASISSAVLLTVFSVAIAINLIQGRRVQCNCFGQLGHAYISKGLLARNAALLGLAAVPLLVESDYLALHRLFAGGAVHPDEPALTELAPLLLIWMAAVLGWALVASVWSAAVAVASAVDGPAEHLPETRWIRRIIRAHSVQTTPAPADGE